MAYHRQQGVTLRSSGSSTPTARAPPRRSRDSDSHPPGNEQKPPHRSATVADAELLLRGRSHPRPDPAGRERRAHAGEHRQPGNSRPPAGREGDRGLGQRARSSTRRCRPTTGNSGSPTSHARQLLGWEPDVSPTRASSGSLATPTEPIVVRRLLFGRPRSWWSPTLHPGGERIALFQVGLFDDTSFNTATPIRSFVLKQLRTQGPGQLVWGGRIRRRQATAREPHELERSRVHWVVYDRR